MDTQSAQVLTGTKTQEHDKSFFSAKPVSLFKQVTLHLLVSQPQEEKKQQEPVKQVEATTTTTMPIAPTFTNQQSSSQPSLQTILIAMQQISYVMNERFDKVDHALNLLDKRIAKLEK